MGNEWLFLTGCLQVAGLLLMPIIAMIAIAVFGLSVKRLGRR